MLLTISKSSGQPHSRVLLAMSGLLILTVAANFGGCKKPKYLDGFVDVSGVVTVGGQPLKSGIVSFVPAEGLGSTVTGEIHSNGEYQLYTSPNLKGITPGVYQVKIEPADASSTADDSKATSAVPKKYQDPKTSGIELTITPQPKQQKHNLELTE